MVGTSKRQTCCRNQPQPSSDVILEEGDDKLVHLIRELLLNKMASFSNTGTSIFGSAMPVPPCNVLPEAEWHCQHNFKGFHSFIHMLTLAVHLSGIWRGN